MPGRLYGAAAEFTMRKYGGGMAENEKTVLVGTSSSEVLGNDPERVFVLLINLSTNTIYIGLESSVGAANGILLAANGGSLEMDVESDLILPVRGLHAVAAAASSTLYVLSMRREFVVPAEEA